MIKFDKYSIRKLCVSDADELNKLLLNNKDRLKTYFPKTLEQNLSGESSKIFTFKKVEQFKTKEEFLFVLLKDGVSQVLGLIYFKDLNWNNKQGEFAYCIDVNYEGKGLITKAVKKLSEYLFEKLGLEILQIIVHKENLASVKVAKKCNFSWVKTLLNEFIPQNGHSLDMELYELYK